MPGQRSQWRRRVERAGIAVGVVLCVLLVLCCTGSALVGYEVLTSQREEREIEEFTEALCDDLEAADHAAVYRALSHDVQRRYSLESFSAVLAARPPLVACIVYWASRVLWDSYVVFAVAGEFRESEVVRQDGGWKVDSDLLTDLVTPARHGTGGGGGDWD